MSALLFLVLFGLMAIGTPLAVALGLSGTFAIWWADLGIMGVPANFHAGIAKYPLLAIPLFILAGTLFERSGVAARLVRLAMAIVGRRRGGLALAAVMVCMILGGISGSGPADAAAVATIMVPSMLRAGYPKAFSAGLIAAGGATAIIIPPSVALILYSVLVPQATVTALFAAGIVPGLIAGLALMVPAWWLSVRHGFGNAEPEADRPRFWPALRDAGWGLMAPVIILGGMRTGLFTPTEAAVVAVAYGLFVGVVVYRSLDLAAIGRLMADSAEIAATVMLIIAFAAVFAFAGNTLGTFDQMARGLLSLTQNEWLVLFGIMVILLVAGMFLDAVSILLIFIPLLSPVMRHYEWDPVWFGVVMTLNMAIGQFTPPMAVNLMVTTRIAGVSVESTVPWVMWLVGAMSLALVSILLVPDLVMFLPRMLGYA